MIALTATARAAPDPDYRRELVERAVASRLFEERGWHALLHYRPRAVGSGVESLADAPRFFLAEEGRRDPRAELEATLTAFFEPAPEAGDDAQHPQCAFIARYHWLRERLDFDPERLPPRPCPRYDELRRVVEPTGATLVFAEAFMDNPASMFGHTLLRIDVSESADQRDLLAWAVNFAALTGNEGGALFALKGLAGLYPGFFTIHPYYEKVKEYGDWENRDIWEYRLDLTPAEIDRILMHLWELRDVYFDYYYFDENCSFHLLSLLEVARPELRLSDHYELWAIPADTVRTVVHEAGLVRSARFRPSAATSLRRRIQGLDARERRLVREVALGRVPPDAEALAALRDERRAAVLSVAYDYLRFVYLAGDVDRASSAARSRRILIARSRVDVRGAGGGDAPAPAVRPDQGHDPARYSLGGGFRDDRWFSELRIRPAFHDLLDPEGGYLANARIQILDLAVRYFPEQDRVRLHEAVLLDIASLAPRDRFFRPLSWRFSTGARTRLISDGGDLEDESVWRTDGGVGLALRPVDGVVAYALAEAALDAGRALEHDVAVGAGGSAGLLISIPGDRWKGHLFTRGLRFELGDRTTALSAGLEQRVRIGRRAAVALRGSYERAYGEGWLDAQLRWSLYY